MWPYFADEADETVGVGRRLFHSASRRALGRMLSRRMIEGLFVHSDRTRSLLLAGFSEPSIADRIHVVPDPVYDTPTITVTEARAELGLPAGHPVILFFGDVRYDKGPDILLEALTQIDGDWVTVMAGPPFMLGELEAEACRRRLQDPARLITRFEFVPQRDADLYFRAADAVVLPYRADFKGTSGVLGRAAAAGKPVIASDVGDVGAAVRRAGLGTVVPAESPDDLAAALQDFVKRWRQVAEEVEPRAAEFARRTHWRVLGEETRARYVSAIESAGP
jgi:glycosyltransferase involved in cell wall biosynthesis